MELQPNSFKGPQPLRQTAVIKIKKTSLRPPNEYKRHSILLLRNERFIELHSMNKTILGVYVAKQ
jgi:hypothetical protein